MAADDIANRVRETSSFSYPYIGQTLKLDGITIRSISGDADSFRKTVEMVKGQTEMPLVLWSSDPVIMAAGLEVAGESRPLIYAADELNWEQMAELAIDSGCPLAVHADGNVGTIRSLISAISDRGVKNLLIDPGCGLGRHFRGPSIT